MTDKIKKYIDEHKENMPFTFIYENLRAMYNEHDIKFVFLTCYNYDIDLEYVTEMEEREKRQYQKLLRQQTLEKYKNRCVVSGIKENMLLEVAHIKPVSKCDNNQEKSDVDNTLLLWIDIHKYFDDYKISINPETMKVEVKCDYLVKYNNLKVEVDEETKKYLKLHYEIFSK